MIFAFKNTKKRLIFLINGAALAAPLILSTPVVMAGENGDCMVCHGQAETGAPLVAHSSFNKSIHGQHLCVSCHADAAELPHGKLAPATCGRCHQNVAAVYHESIHGQAVAEGIKEAPICTDCHGEHTIRSPKSTDSTVWTGAVTKTCSGCHDSERLNLKLGLPTDRLASYLDTYHGLASQRGDLKVANCASCHGFHDVLPSTDQRSSINKANLPVTCGRCHPGVSHKLAAGSVHGEPKMKHWTLSFVRLFYLLVIPLTLGFMFLHCLLDWFRKALRENHAVAHVEETIVRLTVSERIQHLLLLVTFVLLAYTGFALKFPGETWVKVFAPYDEVWRKSIHRWAALVFCLTGLFHFFHLALTKRGRFVLWEMLPRPADAAHFFHKTMYNLGLRGAPPVSKAFYHYPEKIEYWSLIWGSLVMIFTGGLLIFNNTVLKHFPAWIQDLATMVHTYEAVLACLAILIWHFYGVIFDPDVYPMNWAWLTGWTRRKKPPPTPL